MHFIFFFNGGGTMDLFRAEGLVRKLVADRAARVVAAELHGARAQTVHQVLDDRIADRFLLNQFK